MRYYIDEIKGKDENDGSIAFPKKTMKTLIQNIKSGDSIQCMSDINVNKFSELLPKFEEMLTIDFKKYKLIISTTPAVEPVANKCNLTILRANVFHSGGGDVRVFYYRSREGNYTKLYFNNCVFNSNYAIVYLGENDINGSSTVEIKNSLFMLTVSVSGVSGIKIYDSVSTGTISGFQIVQNCKNNITVDSKYHITSDGNLNKTHGVYSGKYTWMVLVPVVLANGKKYVYTSSSIDEVTYMSYGDIYNKYVETIDPIDTHISKIEHDKYMIEIIKKD